MGHLRDNGPLLKPWMTRNLTPGTLCLSPRRSFPWTRSRGPGTGRRSACSSCTGKNKLAAETASGRKPGQIARLDRPAQPRPELPAVFKIPEFVPLDPPSSPGDEEAIKRSRDPPGKPNCGGEVRVGAHQELESAQIQEKQGLPSSGRRIGPHDRDHDEGDVQPGNHDLRDRRNRADDVHRRLGHVCRERRLLRADGRIVICRVAPQIRLESERGAVDHSAYALHMFPYADIRRRDTRVGCGLPGVTRRRRRPGYPRSRPSRPSCRLASGTRPASGSMRTTRT